MRTIPEGSLIVTNAPDAVFNTTRRSSIAVPLRGDATTNRRNPAYEAEVAQLGPLLRREHGRLVLYSGRLFGQELPGRLGLVPKLRAPGVQIYASR